ncbi:unnamed protein product [Camellia sinensis]
MEDPQICAANVFEIYQDIDSKRKIPKSAMQMYPRYTIEEAKRRPLPDYIEMAQKDVSPNMRAILVDWLVEVSEEYELHSDTLHLSISYSDRFLSTNDLNRKYEKINHPPVDEFCYLTDNAYTEKEVVKMEADILKHIKFEVGSPTIMTFLGKVTVVALEDYQIPNLKLEFLGYYLAELSLLENDYVILLPSLVATSVVFLSRFTIQPKLHPWSFSSYKPADLKECVLIIHDLQLSKRGGSLVASRNKYNQHEEEVKRRPLPDYVEMAKKDVSPNMRAILVDWLVKVAEEYKFHSDTLHLSISYIDRFLSMNDLNRKKLQLLGVSSMLIALKYEKINHPPVDEFCYLTDNAYTKKEVVKMEADILKHLKFEVGGPTIMTFLGKFIVVAQKDYQIPNLKLEFLGYYLAELSLLENDCVILLLALVAASVVFLSCFTIQPKLHPWSSALQDFSGYKPADLTECVLIIHDLQLSKRRGSLVASRNKYKQHEFKCISTLASPQEIPNSFFEDVKDS